MTVRIRIGNDWVEASKAARMFPRNVSIDPLGLVTVRDMVFLIPGDGYATVGHDVPE